MVRIRCANVDRFEPVNQRACLIVQCVEDGTFAFEIYGKFVSTDVLKSHVGNGFTGLKF